jgi:DNA-binding transcriptional ArsR family regulator
LDNMHEVFESAARYFSVLAEPARLKILHAICGEEKSVNTIIAATGMAQANASRHLGLMYQAGMLSRRREGTQVFYKVADRMFIDLCHTVSVQIAGRLEQAASASNALFVPPAVPLSALSPFSPSVPSMVAAAAESPLPSPSNQKEKTSV